MAGVSFSIINDMTMDDEDQLGAIVKKRIAQEGPLSFKDYMEAALYYPGLGYYMAEREKIGTGGDFYTSCCLGPVFGAMIGKQVEEMWALSGEEEFTIVEFGAGDGRLCRDILDYFRNYTDKYLKLYYVIIEKSPAMRKLEQALLPADVLWCDNLDELRGFTGCVLSNELLDNFAVHRVVMQDSLMEVFVDDKEGFTEVLRPAGVELISYFRRLKVSLPYGYCTEVNLQVKDWLSGINDNLKKGYILTIDYGDHSAEMYRPSRGSGTLLCYRRHQLSENFYEEPGSRDMTAHVNFSALRDWGEQMGLSAFALTSQAEFLLKMGFSSYVSNQATPAGDVVTSALQASRITRSLLVDMGSKFKVLVQQKSMGEKSLTAFKRAT